MIKKIRSSQTIQNYEDIKDSHPQAQFSETIRVEFAMI